MKRCVCARALACVCARALARGCAMCFGVRGAQCARCAAWLKASLPSLHLHDVLSDPSPLDKYRIELAGQCTQALAPAWSW